MDVYENFSREELIQRIKELETNLSQSAMNNADMEEMSENLANQRKINFLNILMNTILSNVFVAISVKDIFDLFGEFYKDFNRNKAIDMCHALGIEENSKIKTMSKGTKEKVQLILVMSREAQLYLLDEPIAGVDPAAREYILSTIINNYNENGTVIISTHLISDIERILDEVIFIKDGKVIRHEGVDEIKEKEGKSIDAVFRDAFRMEAYVGYRDPENLRETEKGVKANDR